MSVGEVEPSDFSDPASRSDVGILLGSMLAAISMIPVWLFAGKRLRTLSHSRW